MVNQYFNTSLFTVKAIGTYGNAPRNLLANPGFFNIDLAAIKHFAGNIVGTGNFGKLTFAAGPRILQFALKFVF